MEKTYVKLSDTPIENTIMIGRLSFDVNNIYTHYPSSETGWYVAYQHNEGEYVIYSENKEIPGMPSVHVADSDEKIKEIGKLLAGDLIGYDFNEKKSAINALGDKDDIYILNNPIKAPEPNILADLDTTDYASFKNIANINDISTNGNHGTLTNVTKTELGHAFNGTNSRIRLKPNFINWQSSFTISLWFKTSTSGIILGQAGSDDFINSNGYVPGIYIDSTNKLRVSTFWSNSTTTALITKNVTDNNWHHCYIDWNSSTNLQTIWLDGVQVSSYTKVQVSYVPGAYYYWLGIGKAAGWPSTPSTLWFNGEIAAFRAWNINKGATGATSEFNRLASKFGL